MLNNALQGRFASLFLVIAGLGLGLFKQKYDKNYDIESLKEQYSFFCRFYQFTILGTRYNSYVFNLFFDGNCFLRLKKEILMVIMIMNSLVQYILLQNLNYELGFTINYDYLHSQY